MALNDDKIKDLFSSKLGGFEPELPASVWGGLDQLLSQQAAPAPNASSSASQGGSTAAKSSALKTSLVAAGVAASVALGIYLAYNPAEVIVPPTVAEEPVPVTLPVAEAIEENTLVLEVADFVAARAVAAPVAVSAPIEEPTPASVAEVIEEVKEEAKVKEVAKELIVKEEMAPALEMPKFFKEDITLAFNTNVGAMSDGQSEAGGGLLFSKVDRSAEFIDLLQSESKDHKLTHKQPISFGLTVSKKLTRSLSLETGLVFTYLSSNITSKSASNIKEEQVFGYLGIPIKLNYEFYEWHKTKFYVSLGATMQKDVFGRYTSKLARGKNLLDLAAGNASLAHTLYAEPTYIKKNISQPNWQFSGSLSLGAAYPIYRKLYINASVGAAYYLDAKNDYRTIFADRQIQLDLNLGLKIDF